LLDTKPIRDGGKVVGAKITVALFPDRSQDRVQIGLGRTDRRVFSDATDDYFRASIDPSMGHLLHQFPEESGLKTLPQVERTYELRYGQGNTLKGGEEVEVISAWHGTPTWYNAAGDKSRPHIWGMQRRGIPIDRAFRVTLPQ
jgi:hypothetical protein